MPRYDIEVTKKRNIEDYVDQLSLPEERKGGSAVEPDIAQVYHINYSEQLQGTENTLDFIGYASWKRTGVESLLVHIHGQGSFDLRSIEGELTKGYDWRLPDVAFSVLSIKGVKGIHQVVPKLSKDARDLVQAVLDYDLEQR